MSAVPGHEAIRSLAAASTGEDVEVRRILFDALRTLCTDLGLHEGDVVHCRAGTASHLWLDTPAGRTVAIERDWARFIQVASPGFALPDDAAPRSMSPSGAAD